MSSYDLDLTKWTAFRKINKVDQIDKYLNNREYKHSGFYHYTNLNAINKILENKYFLISNINGFNDKADIRQFNSNKNCYSLCFSTGKNENLSLWYLYSGADGKGGRLNFTKAQIKTLITEGTYTLYKKENGELIKLFELNDDDYLLKFRDIIYYKRKYDPKNHIEKSTVDLKYNTMTNYDKIDYNEFENYMFKHRGFFKNLIWYYEKETRLLIELSDSCINKINTPAEKYVITLKIPEKLMGKFKIDLAPEIKSISNDLKNFECINEYLLNSSNVHYSKYKDDIEMRICDRCKYKNKQKEEK